MRILPLLLALAGAACSAAAPPDPPALVGHYVRARINARDNPDWRGIVGDWQAEYRSDGHLIVQGPNGRNVDSLWRLDGDVLTLRDDTGDMSCSADGVDAASGRYRVRFFGDELHLQPLRDECDGRRSVIESHPLRRVR